MVYVEGILLRAMTDLYNASITLPPPFAFAGAMPVFITTLHIAGRWSLFSLN